MRDRSKLGTKYTCYDCGTKFYDLQRPEPICPRCGANQKDAPSGSAEALALADIDDVPEPDLDEAVLDDEVPAATLDDELVETAPLEEDDALSSDGLG